MFKANNCLECTRSVGRTHRERGGAGAQAAKGVEGRTLKVFQRRARISRNIVAAIGGMDRELVSMPWEHSAIAIVIFLHGVIKFLLFNRCSVLPLYSPEIGICLTPRLIKPDPRSPTCLSHKVERSDTNEAFLIILH